MTEPELESWIAGRRSVTIYLIAATVFALAVVARIPSCVESFWVDELHSAWSIWGTLSDVAPRAAAGNQTPPFFWALWLWKQVFGDSEMALRLPSVLAVSTAAAVVTIGLYRVRGSLLAASVGGLVLVIESNALFYGTELRPFAVVIALGAIASWVATTPLFISDHGTISLAVIAIAAAVFQPTAIGVIAWLVILRYALSQFRFGTRQRLISRSSFVSRGWWLRAMLVLTIVILFGWLSGRVIGDAWRYRSQWSDMGRANSMLQIWQAWPWGILIVLPAMLLVVTKVILRRIVVERSTVGSCVTVDGAANECPITTEPSVGPNRVAAPRWITPLAAILALGSFWLASAIGIAPIFHRRYFVASLPILAWACGEGVATAVQELGRFRLSKATRVAVSFVFAAMPLILLMATQGTLTKLIGLEARLTRRGEGWREAVDYLQAQHPNDEFVSLSPGLIETSRLLSDSHADVASYAQWYLTYPLRGPYAVSHAHAVDLSSTREIIKMPLIFRGSRSAAQRWISTTKQMPEEKSPTIHSFGNIQVINFPNLDLSTEEK